MFVIDGSQTGSANTTLMLSVLCSGFAVPVARVVKRGEKGHFPEEMHLDLLKMIVHICPGDCQVVLLGDGESDGQGLQEWCTDNNWSFVLRTSADPVNQRKRASAKTRIDRAKRQTGQNQPYCDRSTCH